jgi:hypothetical protein
MGNDQLLSLTFAIHYLASPRLLQHLNNDMASATVLMAV